MTFFDVSRTAEGELFTPLPAATSRWTGQHVRGPAIVALLARAVESAMPAGNRAVPARSTFELHSPFGLQPCRVRTRVLKQGRTLTLIEAELLSDERVVARCRSAFLSPTPGDSSIVAASAENAAAINDPEPIWADPVPVECAPPPAELRATATGRLFRSTTTDWSPRRADHRTGQRNLVWYPSESVVSGEAATPFQLAAAASDLGNHVINFGTNGLSHINSDVTLSLARYPETSGIGVCGNTRTAHRDVSIGSAVVFDEHGVCGQATVTSVRHAYLSLTFE